MRFVLMALAAVFVAGVARAAPLEAYGKLPVMDQVAISPDGQKVAFVQPVNGKEAVVVDSLSPAALIGNMPPTTQKVRKLIWADSDHLLAVLSEEGANFGVRREWVSVLSMDLQ